MKIRNLGIGLMVAMVAVVGVCLSAMAEQTVDLSWSANQEADLAGYRMYWGTPCGSPDALAFLADVGNVTYYQDKRVPDGVPNAEYEVTAYDKDGNESGRSNRACKWFTLTYHLSVTDGHGVLWGLVDQQLQPAPKYRIYRNGVDFNEHASDLVLLEGTAYFLGTDGDPQWWIYLDGEGWTVAPNQDPTAPVDQIPGPPSAPTGLKAQ